MCLQVQIAVPESVGPAKEDGGPANPALHREDQPVLGVGAAGRQGDGHHVGQGRLQDVKGSDWPELQHAGVGPHRQDPEEHLQGQGHPAGGGQDMDPRNMTQNLDKTKHKQRHQKKSSVIKDRRFIISSKHHYH